MNPDQILACEPTAASAFAEGRSVPKPARRILRDGIDRVAVVELFGFIDREYAARIESRLYHAATSSSAIVLLIDSPGGSAIASLQLGQTIREIAERVPINAFGDGVVASGAMVAASQCTSVTVSRETLCGSLGTLMVLIDSSQLHKNLGLRVVPIACGRFKSTGLAGTEITSEQIDAIRQTVATTNELLLADVARGRGLAASYVRELADGSMWSAMQSIERRLVDRVARFSDFMQTMQRPESAEEFAHLTGWRAEARVRVLMDGLCGNASDRLERVAQVHPKLCVAARRWQFEKNMADQPTAR